MRPTINVKSEKEPVLLRICNWLPLVALMYFGWRLFG